MSNSTVVRFFRAICLVLALALFAPLITATPAQAGTMREDKVGKWIYRIVGLYVFYLILQIAQGKDVIEAILKPFNG